MSTSKLRLFMILFTFAFILGLALLDYLNIDYRNSSYSLIISVVFAGSFFSIAIYLAFRGMKAQYNQLKKIAKNLNLTYIPPRSSWMIKEQSHIKGQYLNHSIQVRLLGSDTDSETAVPELSISTNVEADISFIISKAFGFSLGSRSYGPEIKSLVFKKFLKKFSVRSRYESSLCKIIDLEAQTQIYAVRDLLKGPIKLKNKELIYLHDKELINDNDREQFEKIIVVMGFIADKINTFAKYG